MKILVTGGVGYIGSHMSALLGELGHEVLVYDNLSAGHRDALLSGRLVVGDLADRRLLEATVREFAPQAVIHFASSIQVAESVSDPLKYYDNNVVNSIGLLQILVKLGVNHVVFSSSAAVYGQPEQALISEDSTIRPINPYGSSKACIEQVLQDVSRSHGVRSVSLRYFNAAGADPLARIGERHDPETHLIPLALMTARGKRKAMAINGTDYATPDGTCLRDYVHVVDLAEAHRVALQYLFDGGASDVFNCGYGHGYSVREVVDAAKKISGKDFQVHESGRREGDPASLVADSGKINRILGWKPKYDDLEYIIKTAWEWEKKQ